MARHSSTLMAKQQPRGLVTSSYPATPRKADGRAAAEALLSELAFVLQAVRSVRASMADSATLHA